MFALLIKSIVAGFSTVAVLLMITLLPYALLGYAIYQGGRLMVRQAVPRLAPASHTTAPAANTSTLLNHKWAA